MYVRIHKQVSFSPLEKELFRDVLGLLSDLQEVLGEIDYDMIERIITDIDNISDMEWNLVEED